MLLLEDYANGQIGMKRLFMDLLSHDNDWLGCQFRFTRSVLLEPCAELGSVLNTLTHRNSVISVHVLTSLRFQQECANRYMNNMINNNNVTFSAYSPFWISPKLG